MRVELNIADRRASPAPTDANVAEAPPWPVLARLPHVGGRAAVRPVVRKESGGAFASPSFDAPSRDAMARPEPPPLELAEPAESEAVVTGAPSRRVSRDGAERRSFVDEAHPTLRGHDWWTVAQPAATAEVATNVASAATPKFRVDQFDRLKSSGLPSDARAVKDTLVGRLFELHARLEPYAGVATTLAIILSIGLMYWLTFGQSRPAAQYPDVLQSQRESPSSYTGQVAPPAAGQLTSQESGPSLPQPAMSAAPSGDATTTSREADPSGPSLSSSDSPSETQPKLAVTPTASDVSAPSGSSPAVPAAPTDASPSESKTAAGMMPAGAYYPTTPYAPFDFTADALVGPSPSVAGPAASIATRPAESRGGASGAPTEVK